jgi:hypothetical protein
MTTKDIRRVAELGRQLQEAGIRLPPDQRDLVVEKWIKAAEAALKRKRK